MRSMLRKCVKGNEGATAIEFAIVAPVLFALIFVVIEFGIMAATANILEGAAANTSRWAKARAGLETIDINGIRTHMLNRSTGWDGAQTISFLDPNRLKVVVKEQSFGWGHSYLGAATNIQQGSWNGAAQSSGNGGGTGVIQQYNIIYKYQTHVPFIADLLDAMNPGQPSNGIYEMHASIVVQNEPDITLP